MAAWTLSARRERDLDAATVQHAQRAVLDASVAMLAGLERPEGRALVRFLQSAPPPGVCRLLGSHASTSAAHAAYAGTALCQVHDANDGHPDADVTGGSYHPGRVMVPAALALAQEVGWRGRELLTAVAVGYDIATGVHHPLSSSPDAYGAAAAACYAYELDREETHLALHIAAFTAPISGAHDFEINNLACAQQSRVGIESALIARQGYPVSYPEYYPMERLAFATPPALGHSFRPIYHKPYPTCRCTHAYIEAAIRLHPEVRDRLSMIEAIRLKGHAIGGAAAHSVGPDRYYKAYELSIPYCAAVALVDGRLGTAQVRPDRTGDPLVQRLQDSTTVLLDASQPPYFGGTVEITMTDGSVHACTIDAPLGSPENPLTDGEIAAKMVHWLGYAQEDTDALLEQVMGLDRAESAEGLWAVLGRLGEQALRGGGEA